MRQGICSLCDQTNDLIKAHAIPRSFFKVFKDGGPHSVFFDVSETADRDATYGQAGVYDQGIPFAECEAKFRELDRYCWEILGSVSLQNPIQEPGYPPHAHRVELAANLPSMRERAEDGSNHLVIYHRVRDAIGGWTLSVNGLDGLALVGTGILCSRLLARDRWEYQSRSQSIVTLTSLRRAARPLPGLLHLQTR